MDISLLLFVNLALLKTLQFRIFVTSWFQWRMVRRSVLFSISHSQKYGGESNCKWATSSELRRSLKLHRYRQMSDLLRITELTYYWHNDTKKLLSLYWSFLFYSMQWDQTLQLLIISNSALYCGAYINLLLYCLYVVKLYCMLSRFCNGKNPATYLYFNVSNPAL